MVLTATGYRIDDRDVEVEGVVGVKHKLVTELAHFVDAIETGTPLWTTPEDNYLVQKLIEDCRAVAAPVSSRAAQVA